MLVEHIGITVRSLSNRTWMLFCQKELSEKNVILAEQEKRVEDLHTLSIQATHVLEEIKDRWRKRPVGRTKGSVCL